MNLVSIYSGTYEDIPYRLMKERLPHQNISHKEMPTWVQHLCFIASKPYLAWYIIKVDNIPVGAIYLTRVREIGIGILSEWQGRGYATQAIDELMKLHPGKFIANINPANEASIALFKKLGFSGPIQITLEKS